MTTMPPGSGDRTPRPRARDNGLPAEHFVALRDIDPRLVASLLEALRLAGIAAYAAPTPHAMGGYLDVRLPDRPTDRLWVDGSRRAEASSVVEGELEAQAPADAEDPFEAIVAGFNAGPLAGERPWPEAEDLPRSEPIVLPPPARVLRPPMTVDQPAAPAAIDGAVDEHFVPDPPPPLPRPPIVTFWAIVGIVGGLVMLFGASLGGWGLDPVLQAVAGLGVLGGFVTLVWRMHDPGDDGDSDDGAVV